MKREETRYLLDSIEFMRDPCDLDMLLFFVRHPRALLTSEQIAAFLGYGLNDIAESLEVLLAADLLCRTQHSSHAARMYRFVASSTDGPLPSLLRLASTRPGRLSLMKALALRREVTSGPVVQMDHPASPTRTSLSKRGEL